MEIKLTNDLVLVRKITKEENFSHGGIVLPNSDEHYETPLQGVVIAVGNGRHPKLSGVGKELLRTFKNLIDNYGYDKETRQVWIDAEKALKEHKETPERIPMQIKIGDTIIFSQHGHQKFKIDGENLIALREESVLAVIKKEHLRSDPLLGY